MGSKFIITCLIFMTRVAVLILVLLLFGIINTWSSADFIFFIPGICYWAHSLSSAFCSASKNLSRQGLVIPVRTATCASELSTVQLLGKPVFLLLCFKYTFSSSFEGTRPWWSQGGLHCADLTIESLGLTPGALWSLLRL